MKKNFYMNRGDINFDLATSAEEVLLECFIEIPCSIQIEPIEMDFLKVSIEYRKEDEDFVNDFIAYYGEEM